VLITSKREGFPMVIMEAMAYGVVPVSTDVGGINMHIKNGVNGYLVPEEDENIIVDRFVEIISRLDQDRSLLHHLSAKAYSYAKETFSLETFNSKYNTLVESCLEGKSA
jgi:glycosyltransferase involved in cell wall biosynthesis